MSLELWPSGFAARPPEIGSLGPRSSSVQFYHPTTAALTGFSPTGIIVNSGAVL